MVFGIVTDTWPYSPGRGARRGAFPCRGDNTDTAGGRPAGRTAYTGTVGSFCRNGLPACR